MKNYYLSFLLLCFCLPVAQAQITLSSANNAIIGETYTYKFADATGVSAGLSGANITWNFSNLTTSNTTTSNVVDPSTLASSSSFPDATLGIKDEATNTATYYYTSPDAQGFYGAVGTSSAGTTAVVYTDPQDWVQYPMTYEDFFNDTFSGTVETNGSLQRGGVASVVADGYGTLITPAGTYPNVLRLKTTMLYADSIGGVELVSYFETRYMWFDTDRGFPLMNMSSLEAGGSTIRSLSYLEVDPLSSTSSPLAQTLDLSMSPNPASDWLNVEYELEDQLAVNATVVNLMEQEVLKLSNEVQAAGKHQLGIDVSGLANGHYFLQLIIDREVATHKLLIQH